jgi:thiol-disulfide isomerase/thioredoxin
MKRVSTFGLLLVAAALLASAAGSARAQAGVRPRAAEPSQKEAGGEASSGAKASEAQALYEDAAKYVERKFEEFRQKQVPYDRLLEQKTYQEQKDLALQNAARLAARGPLHGMDVYYAGLLYALAGNGEGSLDSLRRFLAEPGDAKAELLQRARSVAAQQAAQLGRAEEAETLLADFSKSEPRASVTDINRINLLVASAYVKRKDYAHAAPRAADAYAAALEYARTAAANPVQRDSTIYTAGAYYANALAKSNRRPEALNVVQEMRARAVALPSARLYRDATGLLLQMGGEFGAPPALSGVEPSASPEIAVAEMIGAGPRRLADLRGKVVFLDFWATWCTYCVQTMPRLNALHQKYKDRGFVVLGLNEFEGNIQGREASRAEELEYFRQFKRRMNVSYDFAVAADAENDRLYGIASLPTGVLIDRRGRVRLLTIGASEEEADLVKKMVVKLLDETP